MRRCKVESLWRGLVVYAFLLVVFRLSGKRTLSESTPFDLVLLLIVSETTQQAMVGNDHSMTNAALLMLTLVGADILLSVLKQRWRVLEPILDGTPVLLMQGGRVLQDRLDAERVDTEDILEAARLQEGIEDLDQINLAVLERSGEISVVPRAPG
jgi:uncharacterized membrane protein YcaP (DUF421 family)